ncbi:MAG: phosphatase PAP2 family protein [Oscillospiraceae bacterium]|nr:phosphatase PAP2 family protein [Oscillospiraceae bacterium]
MEQTEMVDYRQLSLKTLNEPRYSHVKLLLFWPSFGIVFYILERVWIRDGYHIMSCSLDAHIPFCEWFVIPYFFWFIFIIGMHIYTLLYDVPTFQKFIRYIAITYWASVAVYILFPNCQEFRPVEFTRDNWMVHVVQFLYGFDTNTNVCPSLHVVGSMAVMFAAWHSKKFSTRGWKIAFGIMAFVISVSTVFLRQHSVLDLLAAVPICLIAAYIVYGREDKRIKAQA